MNTGHQFSKNDILKRTKSEKPAPTIQIEPTKGASTTPANEATPPYQILRDSAVGLFEVGPTQQGKTRSDRRATTKMAKIEMAAAGELKYGSHKTRKRNASRRKRKWHQANGTSNLPLG